MKIKKIFALMLSICLMASITTNVKAKDDNQLETNIINEYEYITKLKAMSDDELYKLNINDEEIKEIRGIDFKSKLEERAKLDEATLKNIGYSDEEIKMLRNFKGTKSEIKSLTADMSYSMKGLWDAKVTGELCGGLGINDGTKSSAVLRYDWEWDKQPVINNTDIVAICWTDGFYFTSESWLTFANVSYKSIYFQYDEDYQVSQDIQANIGSETVGCYIKFPMYKEKNPGGEYAYKGTLSVQLLKNSPQDFMNYKSAYGHSTVTINPSVSFPAGGSISFALTMTTLDEDSGFLNLNE